MDIQLVCSDLSRLPEVKTLLSRATARRELADGIALEFPTDDAMARTVLEFVLEERRCCAQFTYDVRFAADPVRLTLTVQASDAHLQTLNAMYAA